MPVPVLRGVPARRFPLRSTRLALAGLTGLTLSLPLAGCGIFGGAEEEPGDLQVYSARHYDLEERAVRRGGEAGVEALPEGGTRLRWWAPLT